MHADFWVGTLTCSHAATRDPEVAMLLSSVSVVDTVARLRRVKRSVERGAARVRFTLGRRTCVLPLGREQVRRYYLQGYVLVRGLVPDSVVDDAVKATWEGIGAAPDDEATWPLLGPGPHELRDARLLACYTPPMMAAASQLCGEHVSAFPAPSRAFTINRVPRKGEWRPNGAHLDYSLEAMRHRTFPRPFRIGAMTYLTDVERHGGGTMVWPGSQVQVAALAASDRERYALVSALQRDLGLLELGAPVELTPRRGDVLFHDALLVHASSENVSDRPRLAINHKW